MNLMVTSKGALGDQAWLIPALTVLRERYDKVFMTCREQGRMALSGTGLIDQFIVRPLDWLKFPKEKWELWLRDAVSNLAFEHRIVVRGIVPGRLMFHRGDKHYGFPVEWKRQQNAGKNYWDETSKYLTITGLRSMGVIQRGVPEAVGKRPVLFISDEEKDWLGQFRSRHGIPKGAFLLGWQFTGSSQIKWYPYFDQVIQKGVMRQYPNVYVVGMGDLKGKMVWGREYHHGRFINLKDTVSFRQAYLLTSIMDCLVSPETGVFNFAQAFPNVPKILLATHTSGKQIVLGDETTILQPECDCSPCYSIIGSCPWADGLRDMLSVSQGARCMSTIPPEHVIKAIEDILN